MSHEKVGGTEGTREGEDGISALWASLKPFLRPPAARKWEIPDPSKVLLVFRHPELVVRSYAGFSLPADTAWMRWFVGMDESRSEADVFATFWAVLNRHHRFYAGLTVPIEEFHSPVVGEFLGIEDMSPVPEVTKERSARKRYDDDAWGRVSKHIRADCEHRYGEMMREWELAKTGAVHG